MISNNKVFWLETLLKDQIARDLSLKLIDEYYVIHFLGTEKSLKIGKIITEFYCNNNDIEFRNWDFDKEGILIPELKSIPAPGLSHFLPIVEIFDDCICINYDFLGFAFWTLNRLEEANIRNYDSHSRVCFKDLYSVKNGYFDRPVIDEWFYIIRRLISISFTEVILVEKSFQISLTHDVDNISLFSSLSQIGFLKFLLKRFLRGEKLINLFSNSRSFYFSKSKFSKDPYNTFDFLIDLARNFNVSSTFFFITKRYGSVFDATYDFDSNEVDLIIKKIVNSGNTIGLHTSYDGSSDFHLMKEEFRLLLNKFSTLGIDQKIIGSRSHYLRWIHGVTMINLNELGVNYDTTLGFADRPGFRCGTCHSYQGYDLITDRVLSIYIKPLIVMDTSLFSPSYMGLTSKSDILECVKNLKSKCVLVNGCFTLLWHNCQLTTELEKEILIEILKQ